MSQTATIAISLEELAIVLSILRARIPDRAVWVFGSRANGNARRRSDLDLAVDGDEPLPLRLRSELAEDFDKRSGALMTDGRRTLGDISRAVNNLDRNPTRLLFGASSGSNSNAAAPAPATTGTAEKRRP